MAFNHRELIGHHEFVIFRMRKINQPDQIAAILPILLITDFNSFCEQAMERFIIYQSIRRMEALNFLERFLLHRGRNIPVNTLNGGPEAVLQDYFVITPAFRILTIRSDSRCINADVAKLFKQLDSEIFYRGFSEARHCYSDNMARLSREATANKRLSRVHSLALIAIRVEANRCASIRPMPDPYKAWVSIKKFTSLENATGA